MRKILTGLALRPHQKESALVKLCEKKLHAPCRYFRILKKSLDARDKSDIKWVYSVECGTEPYVPPLRVFPKAVGAPKVVIAGAGPAGLFCALRLLDARVSVSAHVALYAPLETDVVLDAYSTGFETKLRYADTAFRTVCDGVRDTALCRGAPDLSGISVSEVLDLSCTDFSYAAKVENGELVLTGRAQLGILYADTEGAPGYVERGVDVAYRRAVTTGAGEMSCEAHAAVSGTGFVLTGDSQLDARVELDISATVFSGETLRLVEEVALDTQKPLSRTAAALTIYFADAGESVWEIARRYSTTVEAVKAENGLKSDVLDGDCKLLIPSV